MLGSVVIRTVNQIENGTLKADLTRPWPVKGSPYETDFGEFDSETPFVREGCDLFVLGHAYPTQAGGTTTSVELRIGPSFVFKMLVYGDRKWTREGWSLVPDNPKAFERIPLTWNHAFGGTCKVDGLDFPSSANPKGLGFYWEKEQAEGQPLPNIEDPDNLIRKWDDRPKPVGTAPYPRYWELRILNSVEYDLSGKLPKIKRIKPAINNNALPRLILPKSPGTGDIVVVTGVRPGGKRIEFRMPPLAFHIYVQLHDRKYVFPAKLEAMAILAEEGRVMLGFRSCFRYRLVPMERRAVVLYSGTVPVQPPAEYTIDWTTFKAKKNPPPPEPKAETKPEPKISKVSEAPPKAPSADETTAPQASKADSPSKSNPPGPTAPLDLAGLFPPPKSATEHLLSAQPDGSFELALVFKRTYQINKDGRCQLADEQIPIETECPRYNPDAKESEVSPPCWDSDYFAFKSATDVVVQGHAYAYSARATIDAELRLGQFSRVIRVYGDRSCDLQSGRIHFSPPTPFEKMPLRYDRAYGGCDTTALARHGDPLVKKFDSIRPEWHLKRSTRYHYPRNPSGRGYLIEADRESLAALLLPNLEYPFDLVTPERLAIGNRLAWLAAPLPAGLDWFDPGWFPRLACIGCCPRFNPPQKPVSEIAFGWAPPEILQEKIAPNKKLMPRFAQGASPGLSIPNLDLNAEFVLRNLFPDTPEGRFKLPGAPPKVTIELSTKDKKSAETQLNTVVIQPDARRLVLVWSARTKVARSYAPQQLANMRWQIIEGTNQRRSWL